MSSATFALAAASTAAAVPSFEADTALSTVAINRPTVSNSCLPKPREVAAAVPSRIPEVTVGFS